MWYRIACWYTMQTNLMVHDLAICLHQRLSIKGCLSIKHLVHAHTERPPVTLRPILSLPILHSLQDLRRDVVWGPNCNRGLDLWENVYRKTEIYNTTLTEQETMCLTALGLKIKLTVPSSMSLRQEPKSASRMWPFMSIRILSGLISLIKHKTQITNTHYTKQKWTITKDYNRMIVRHRRHGNVILNEYSNHSVHGMYVYKNHII